MSDQKAFIKSASGKILFKHDRIELIKLSLPLVGDENVLSMNEFSEAAASFKTPSALVDAIDLSADEMIRARPTSSKTWTSSATASAWRKCRRNPRIPGARTTTRAPPLPHRFMSTVL
jgi:hypothetical protein